MNYKGENINFYYDFNVIDYNGNDEGDISFFTALCQIIVDNQYVFSIIMLQKRKLNIMVDVLSQMCLTEEGFKMIENNHIPKEKIDIIVEYIKDEILKNKSISKFLEKHF